MGGAASCTLLASIGVPSQLVTELEPERRIRRIGLEVRVTVVLDLVLEAADEAT
jgi:hypothetical protein